MPDDTLTVEEIRLENVFGVRELSFDPDGVTVIRGDNDTGKTSVLRAISLLRSGGEHPEALHKGADSGKVEFELSDGTRVWASLTEKHTYYRVDGRDDVTARELLEGIQDEISANPISILQARPRDRGPILLESMPMTIDPGQVTEAIEPVPVEVLDVRGYDLDGHALEVLGDKSDGLISKFYEKRQSLHGAKRDKEGTINDLKRSVQQHGDPDELKSEREEVQQGLDEKQSKKEDDLQEVNEWENKKLEEIRRKANEKREAVREKHDPEIEELREKRATLNEQIEQATEAEKTKSIIEEREAEYAALEDKYDRLTQAIENLRSLRTDFQEDLPEGVSLDEDGEILNDEGIRFENWNEQSKVQFAMELAEKRTGELALIPLDGIENVVGEQRERLIEFCKKSSAQFILTEAVEGKELTVERA